MPVLSHLYDCTQHSTQHRYLCGSYDKIIFIVELSFMDVGIDTYDKFQFC